MKVALYGITGVYYKLGVNPLLKTYQEHTDTIKHYVDDLDRIQQLMLWFTKSPERLAWIEDDRIAGVSVYTTSLQISLAEDAGSDFIADAVRIFETKFEKSTSYDKQSITLSGKVDPKDFFGISMIQISGYKPAGCTLVTYRESVSEARKAAIDEELTLGTLKTKMDCSGFKTDPGAPDPLGELDDLLAVNSSQSLQNETNSLDSEHAF